MADLTLLSPEDLSALASSNFAAMSDEGKQIAFSDLANSPAEQDTKNPIVEEVSKARQFQYGFDKTRSDIGLLYRTLQVKAGLGLVQMGDDGSINYIPADQAYGENFVNASDEVKAATLARLDQIKLEQAYPILSQQEEPGGWVTGGSFVGALFSPTTLIPIGAAGKVGYKALSVGGAAFGAEYNILDQLASTAKINPKEAALVTGVSAIATPVAAKSLNILGKGIARALTGRSSPKIQTKADEDMLEIQAIINDVVSQQADNAPVPTFDDLLPVIQKRMGLSVEQLQEIQIQSNVTARIPESKSQALAAIADEAQSLNAFTSSSLAVQAARDFVGVVSTDIARINPLIGGRLKKHDSAAAVKSSALLQRAEPFLKLANRLPEKTLSQLNRHLISEDFSAAKTLVSKYDPNAAQIIDDTSALLQEIDIDLRKAGFQFGKVNNYFPRKMLDYKEFLKDVGIEYKTPIRKALDDRAAKLGFKNVSMMPQDEVEEVIASILKRPLYGKINQKSLANQSRKVVVDEKLIKHYKKPQDALTEHINDSVARIEKRNFFGKAAQKKGIKGINLEDSVDSLIAQEISAGRMADEDFGKLKELLEARFGMGERQAGKGANLTKNLIYQMTIANPMSALTQIADLGMSVFANGLLPTLKAMIGKRKITLKDINFNQMISAEMGTVGRMGKMLDTTFKYSGFKWIDKLGKETIVNAAYSKFQKMSRSTQGVKGLRKRFGNVFGDEFDLVVSDLKSGNITENVKMMMFSELSNYQPISLSEMPLKYLQANNGRVFYALKSFTIKQFDVMRREIFHELDKGNTAEGMKKFLAYTTILSLAGGSVQEVKDFISRGDKIAIEDMPDQMVKNLFKIMGTSQWIVENRLKEGKIVSAIGEAVLPPISLFDGLSEDLSKLAQGTLESKDSKVIQRIPPFGRLVQDWMLGAREEKRIKDILAD